MEKKINLVELLKNCPQGMELDCVMYDNCTFKGIEDLGYIDILINTPSGIIRLTKEGCFVRHDDNAKCVIFPKGKTTWEGFVPPCKFKDGDIITMENDCGKHTFIYNNTTDTYNSYGYYVIITSRNNFKIDGFCGGSVYRLATEEEKQKLFDAIKEKYYKWNAETKTLEKLIVPKFKVGDTVRKIGDYISGVVVDIDADYYYNVEYEDRSVSYVNIKAQDEWELVSNKFDISTLKPFESKVLVRKNTCTWQISYFGFRNRNKTFTCLNGHVFPHCIPYEGNEHLLGTNNDCDEFYKTWE